MNIKPLILVILLTLNSCYAQENSDQNSAPDQVAPASPQTESQRYLKLEQLHYAGNYAEALKVAKALQKDFPQKYQYPLEAGTIAFNAGQMAESIQAYDRVIELAPQAQASLWQRGLGLYYAKRFEDGKRQFEVHKSVNANDVENAVWHMLCAAKVTSVDDARQNLMKIRGDQRVPMPEIYLMFGGQATPEEVMKAATQTSARVPRNSPRYNAHVYYAHLYTGLYHEMMENTELAKASIQKAAAITFTSPDVLMGQVARVHLKLRGWEPLDASEPATENSKK